MGYMTLQKPPQSFIITNKVFRLNNQIYFKGFLSFGMLFNYTTFRHMSIINLGENSVSSVKTKYGNLVAVDDVDFEIYKGEIFGLVGESGSGKSTIGSMIAGIYASTAGSITFKGKYDITKNYLSRSKELKRDTQCFPKFY